MDALVLFAQVMQDDGSMDVKTSGFIVGAALAILIAIGLWKMFRKAKQPGWAAIIPIYDIYITLKVAGRPGWWLWLYLVPIVNVIVHAVVAVDVAKAFKKSTTFGIFGLWLFPMVGTLILGYGDAKYKGVPKH